MQTSHHRQDSKSARLSCRVRATVKEQAETAAQMLGLSKTDFAETALAEKAQQVIAENERILLSEKAFEEFVAAIYSPPPKPSKKLLQAVVEYNRHAPVTVRP